MGRTLPTYDDLHRLRNDTRGRATETGFTAGAGGREWDLDLLGNWNEMILDTASSYGTFGGSDQVETRKHNGVNEVWESDPDGAGSAR